MNIIEHFTIINIIQFGCGGTGSWVVPLASKLINNIKLRLPETTKILYKLVDDDGVEERNILRQNFSSWDIGKSKAHSLVNRFIYNFKDIEAFPKRINKSMDLLMLLDLSMFEPADIRDKILTIVLGCVDNNSTRQFLYKNLKKYGEAVSPVIYIDSGNLLYNGQIVTQSFGFEELLIQKLEELEPDKANELKEHIKKRKKLKFLKMFPLNAPEETQQSCAFFGDQSQSINSLAATIMFCNLQKILVNSEMPPQVINFNNSGYSTFEL